jgi:hypothetical protein
LLPQNHPPSLLFFGIDKDYDENKLQMLIENLLMTKYLILCRSIPLRNVHFNSIVDKAYAEFDSFDIADTLIKVQMFAKNAKGFQIKITYAIDATKLKQMMWSAVVIRNLPSTISKEKVAERCRDENERVKYVLPVTQIKGNLVNEANIARSQ